MASYQLVIGAAGLTNIPLWLQNVDVNQWVELADTALSDQPGINTGASSGKQNAWCGWIAALKKVYSDRQGGHGDYSGNENDMIDLEDDVPAWTQVLSSSNSTAVTSDSDYYTDGKPCSIHGYYTGIYSPDLNKLLRFPGGSRATLGNPTQNISAFNISTGNYDSEATWEDSEWYLPGSPSVLGANGGAYAIHPATGKVYCWFYNAKLCEWDPADPKVFTTLVSNPSNPAAASTAAAIAPEIGDEGTAFFLGGGAGGTMCRAYDIATNTLRTITLTGTDISADATNCGLVYSETLGKFIVRLREVSGGGTVYGITPTTGSSWACAAISTTGGASIPATDHELAGDAPLTKFLYIPSLGVVVYGPEWGANIWALKLHEV